MVNESAAALQIAPLPWSRDQILLAARAMAGVGGFAPALLATLANHDVDPREVVKSILNAPGIALRVLKVANSAFYGRSGEVDSLERAVAMLGLDAVRAVASAACLDRALPAAAGRSTPSAALLLNHSLATALAAQDLSRTLAPAMTCDAFLAGLLHDLGYLVVQRLAPGIAQSESLAAHGECAALVFASWNLPQSLAEVARLHHRVDETTESSVDLRRLVAAAEQLACDAGFGLAIEPMVDQGWSLPGLPADDERVVMIRSRLPRAMSALGPALSA